MTLCEALNKRYLFEQIVSYSTTYDLPNYNSDINSLLYFINNGYKNNRFRKNFSEAMELAKEIINYYERPMELLDKRLER